MNQPETSQNKWIENFTALLEDYRNLISIRITEHVSQGVATSVIGILTVFMAAFVLLFTGLGIAWLLGTYWGNMMAGFFCVGGLYLIVFTFLLFTSRKFWIPRIRDIVIKKIYEQN